MNIDPRGLTVKRWCDQMVSALSAFGQAPFLQDERAWRDWGMMVCKLPGVVKFNPPSPLQFNDFYDWAEQFNMAVRL